MEEGRSSTTLATASSADRDDVVGGAHVRRRAARRRSGREFGEEAQPEDEVERVADVEAGRR